MVSASHRAAPRVRRARQRTAPRAGAVLRPSVPAASRTPRATHCLPGADARGAPNSAVESVQASLTARPHLASTCAFKLLTCVRDHGPDTAAVMAIRAGARKQRLAGGLRVPVRAHASEHPTAGITAARRLSTPSAPGRLCLSAPETPGCTRPGEDSSGWGDCRC